MAGINWLFCLSLSLVSIVLIKKGHWPAELMDEISLFPCNIKTNEVPSIILLLASFGKLNICNKMRFQEIYVMQMKICNFLKTFFFTITLTFIDNCRLNIDDIKEF